MEEAEAAAQAAGASLWYVPPDGYAPRAINGPFVGSDGSGGVPAVGSGVVGFLTDRAQGGAGSDRYPAGFAGATLQSGATISGDTVTLPNAGAQVVMAAQLGVTAGRAYVIEIEVLNATAGLFLNLYIGGAASFGVAIGAGGNGVHRRVIVAGGNAPLIIQNDAGSTGTCQVRYRLAREIPGSHATQSTSANRPVLVAAPGAAAAAAGFGALSFDGVNDNLRTAGQVIDLNADWFMLCAFRATANSGFPWPFAANYTAGGQRAGMYLQADGRIFLALRRPDGSPVDADMRLALASAAGTQRVGYVEKVGSTLTAYNADGSVHLSQSTTFSAYTAGGPARIGAGDGFFNGSVSLAALGNGTVTAQRRQALLSLANFAG